MLTLLDHNASQLLLSGLELSGSLLVTFGMFAESLQSEKNLMAYCEKDL